MFNRRHRPYYGPRWTVGEIVIFTMLCLMVAALVVMVLLMVFMPTCEERGGKKVFSHMGLVMAGKVLVPVAKYRCELPQRDGD